MRKDWTSGAPISAGVADLVDVHVALDPVDIGFSGADGAVFEANGVANLVEQFLGSWFHRFPPVGFDFFRILFYNGFQPPHRSCNPQNCPTKLSIQKFSAIATPRADQIDSTQDTKIAGEGGFRIHNS